MQVFNEIFSVNSLHECKSVLQEQMLYGMSSAILVKSGTGQSRILRGKAMTDSRIISDKLLRRRAEYLIRTDVAETREAMSQTDMHRLLHELQVHQIELELQNNELRQTHLELDASRERYFELFDMAPVGYVTLDRYGVVLECNFTVAKLLGVARHSLVNTPFSRYIFPADSNIFCMQRNLLEESAVSQQCEIRMIRADGSNCWVELKVTLTANNERWIVVNDISSIKRANELSKHAEQYQAMIATNLFGFWLVDATGRVLDVNDTYCRMSGYSRDELVLLSVADLEAAESPEETDRHIEKLIENGIDTFESRHRSKDGRIFDVEISTAYCRSQEEMIVFIRDISVRKRLEEAQTFLAHASSGVVDKEPFFNSLARYLARSLDMYFICIDRLEGDGLTATTVAVWCDGHFEDNVSYALKDTPCGDVVGNEICCFPASVCQYFPRDEVLQDLRAESYVGVTLWSHTGQPIGLIAVIGQKPLENRRLVESVLKMVAVRAASELERQEAEEVLRVSEERFRLAIQATKDGIWEWDVRTNEAFLSPRWCEIIGYSCDDPELQRTFNSWAERIHPDDYERVMQVLTDHLEQRANYDVEFRHRHKSGDYVWHHSRGEAVFDDSGKAIKMIGGLTDISRRKQLDDELQQALENTKSANETMRRLLNVVAHEFRTPLGLLIGSTDILDRYWKSLTPKKRFEHNERIRNAARQMSNLVNSVVSFNQLGNSTSDNRPKLLDIGGFCRTIAAEVESVWSAGHQFNSTIAVNSGTAMLSEMLLRRIVENLLTNAFRYTPSGGTVSLLVCREKNLLCLEIEDTGIGIPEDDLSWIFEPFYRSRNVEGRRGLGVGLSNVHDALLQMGGAIIVNSEIGKGTTMLVEIPVDDHDNGEIHVNNPDYRR